MDFVYILKCNDNTYYTGWTRHPSQRLAAHNSGKGAKYTRCRLPAELVYLELLPDKSQALKRECAIKKLTHQEKNKLVELYKIHSCSQNPFTPIAWISEPKDNWAATTSSINLTMKDYPIPPHQKRKKSKKEKKKENPKD